LDFVARGHYKVLFFSEKSLGQSVDHIELLFKKSGQESSK
jgi:hypothetical protein